MDNSEYRPIPGQTPLTLPPKQEPAPIAPDELPADTTPVTRPATTPPIVKTVRPQFVSPMPNLKETDNEIPAFLPVVAGIAAAVTIAFSVLIYLKR